MKSVQIATRYKCGRLVYAVILSELMQNKPLIHSLLLIIQLRMLSFIRLVIVAGKVHDFPGWFSVLK